VPYQDLLRVMFAAALPPDVTPRLSAAFARNVPGCRLYAMTMQLMEMLRWFDSGRLDADVIIAWFPDPDAGPRPVPDWAPRVMVVSQRHPLAGRSSVDAEELAGHTVMRPWGFAPYAEYATVSPGSPFS
jgi:DNA-binding transcriptional LysR family regulator